MRSVIAAAAALIVACSSPTSAPPSSNTPPSIPATVAQSTPSAADAGRPTPSEPRETPTVDDERLVRALVEFARAPQAATLAAVPFADTVRLGLSDRLLKERASGDLVRVEEWMLREEAFRGYVGPFSALDLLARDVPTTISVGPHPHCASPPVPPPTELVHSRRVSIQPKGIDSCLNWWTVDLFVSPSGRIEAVTLDLWEP